jgi:hypothetical protein
MTPEYIQSLNSHMLLQISAHENGIEPWDSTQSREFSDQLSNCTFQITLVRVINYWSKDKVSSHQECNSTLTNVTILEK